MSIGPLTSIAEYISTVLALRRKWSPDDPYAEIWFRGVNERRFSLLPGAYWRKDCDEHSLVLSFRAMAPGLLPHQPTDEWEWYYLMQHYGLPTRLLDWTENPLAALYFALDGACTTSAPCVWVLDPVALNKLSGDSAIFMPTYPDRPIDNWLPDKCSRGATPCSLRPTVTSYLTHNRFPIAIFPKRHNPRIIAQRGTFTVHGVEDNPIDQLGVKRVDGSDGVVRIDIDPSAVGRLIDELWGSGITRTIIYPEPQSLAADVKRMYGISDHDA